jgi:U4/U6.U5 tri-snRNP-associated protein 3
MARLRMENEEEERRMAAPMDDNEHPNGHDAHGRPRPTQEIIQVQPEELEGLDEEEQMKLLLGFSGGFGSTSGQKVEDNQKSAARGAAAKNKARKYRQYMNRKNGFNRPLDKMD